MHLFPPVYHLAGTLLVECLHRSPVQSDLLQPDCTDIGNQYKHTYFGWTSTGLRHCLHSLPMRTPLIPPYYRQAGIPLLIGAIAQATGTVWNVAAGLSPGWNTASTRSWLAA